MTLCNICLGPLNVPSALPCGHVFCYPCILKVVRSVKPFTTEHRCPMCRERYTVEALPREAVPDALQPHVTPSIRKLDFSPSSLLSQSTKTHPMTSSCEPISSDGLERHQAEILALRAQRAELARRNQQASTNAAGLCMLAKAARAWGMKMQRERDAFASEVGALRKRLREQTPGSGSCSCSSWCSSSGSSSASSCEPQLDSVFCSQPSAGGPLSDTGIASTTGSEPARPRKRARVELPLRLQMRVPADILGPSISRRATPQVLPPKYEPLSPSLSPVPSTPRL
ncbi:hypothetical protein HWV62_11473 [Athelia sp. TMB]|nr:hypothetical protein HWV62_11473 [Athelia sp. TMB]